MRKRIGLFTMHRTLNYGTVLQAFATQKILEKTWMRSGCHRL